MRYIISPEKDGIQFGDYLNALSEYLDQLPSSVAVFASDEERFALSHPKSLHDSWLEQISVFETRATGGNPSRVSVTIDLLGQMHDRKIVIQYQGVTGYKMNRVSGERASHETFHGDIFTHEVRLSEDGLVVHEILFDGDDSLEVICSTFSVEDQLIKN